jgi:hypothetical protein
MRLTLDDAVDTTAPRTIAADLIRLATTGDVASVAALIEEAYFARAASGADFAHVRAMLDAGAASQEESIRDGACYVAESRGQLIGLCAAELQTATEFSDRPDTGAGVGGGGAGVAARIRALVVAPSYSPLALSRLLLTLCESAAARRGFDALEAVATHVDRGLYLACGFRATGATQLHCPGGVAVPALRVRKLVAVTLPPVAVGPVARAPWPSPRSYRTFTRLL